LRGGSCGYRGPLDGSLDSRRTGAVSKKGVEFSGQRVAVIGLAATGLATAKILRDLGAIVTVYDGKPAEKLDVERVREARELSGVSLALGNNEADWNHADLVIPSPGVPRNSPVLEGAQRRGVPILGEIEVAYRLAEAPILAITGTNGKTTTTALVGALCREAGKATWVAGNIAEDAGKRLPLIQAAMEAPANGVIVAEISSFQLEWVEQFAPRVAAWLNIANDHLDRHRDFAEYATAKSNIFRAQTEDDFAVLNADDDNVMAFSEGVGEGERVTFSVDGEHADFTFDGTNIIEVLCEDYPAYIATKNDLRIPGKHNVANAMAALAMATSFGIRDPDVLLNALRKFEGVAHRMEFVAEINGVRYINNSMCTNPAALIASVGAIETPLVAIVGGIHKGGDLSGIGSALANGARQVVFIGKSAPELADALKKAGGTAFGFADSLRAAVEQAADVAKSGETVMLAPGCASFDMFTGFEQRGQVFRDAVKAMKQGGGAGK
jgi:UDP-N-acetylmuramoylalanine--D-glutamate ligase